MIRRRTPGRIGNRSALGVFAVGICAVLAALSTPPARAAPIALGAYIPNASEDPHLIDAFAQRVGRRPVLVLSYKNWSSLPFDRAELGSVWRRGGVSVVTWEPWTSNGRGLSLRQIATGRFDRYLNRAAGSARLWGKPLFVRFAQEMNGSWFPWGARVNGNTPREFRKAWKHIVNLFRARGATNVRWVWSPNEDSGGGHPLAPFYPGDRWVDWIAVDGFNYGGSLGWPSFTTLFGSTYERLAHLSGRPMMIAETGANEEGGDKAAWISSALRREAPRFSRIRALVWFDDTQPDADFRVDSSPASLHAFRAAIDSPAFAANRASLLATPARLSSPARAPAEPDGGYGAPSLLERLDRALSELPWGLVAPALALLLVGVPILSISIVRRRRAAAS